MFVCLARAAAARAAPNADDDAAAALARRALAELRDHSGADHWAVRLAAGWLAER